MYTFLLILLIIISILIILVVLIQPGKGDMVTGMGTIGGSMSSMFGTRRAADMLTKATIGLAVALMLIVIVTNKFFVGTNSVATQKAITEGVVVPSQTAPVPAPVQSTPAPAQEQNGGNQ
jgi:preprotein translocase subunit SecG